MELFPDGGFVRLQSRGNGLYIHAEGNWRNVSLRPLSYVPSLEAVWRVERWANPDGELHVLLQNAAYGRYLSFSHRRVRRAPPLFRLVRRVVQRDYDDPNLVGDFLWRLSVDRVYPDQDHVSLRYLRYHLLAEGGRHLTWDWRWFGVEPFVMMQWTVHAIAATPVPPPLLVPAYPDWVPQQFLGHRRGRMFWVFWRFFGYGPGVYEDVPHEYRHVRANDQGNFEQNQWLSFIDHDIPVVDLWRYLANLQGGNMVDFTLCIRPGSHGRLMPLVTHLPRSRDTLNIVVLRTESQAADALVYPLLYAPAP